MANHQKKLGRTVEYMKVYCFNEEESCRVIEGPDFKYCPYCGDEIRYD